MKERWDPRYGWRVRGPAPLKCHGEKGKGDGASAKKLKLKMVDWTNKERMNKLSDEFLVKITAEGGEAVGKSKLMDAYRDRLSEQEIKDVVLFIPFADAVTTERTKAGIDGV